MPNLHFQVGQGGSLHTSGGVSEERLRYWRDYLLDRARDLHARVSAEGRITPQQMARYAEQVFREVAEEALKAEGLSLPTEWIVIAASVFSNLGHIYTLLADPHVEDIAYVHGHLWVFRAARGWEYHGYVGPEFAHGIHVIMDQAGVRPPSPDHPITDAVVQVVAPSGENNLTRKGLRIAFIMPPASPYGDVITIRVTDYGHQPSLADLTTRRLPPAPHTPFQPQPFTGGDGLLSPAAANYLLSVLVHGGVIVVAGPTGAGKTTLARALIQAMIDYLGRGKVRLFIIEDANEIVLNGWNGTQEQDTGNIVYTVTRPQVPGGPPPVTAYDLIRAALRHRPTGIIVGEARGAEAWELVRAAATGHGHSVFTIHATDLDGVWHRFRQVVQGHPEARGLDDWEIATGFAEAVSTIVVVTRDPVEGQRIDAIAEVATVVERSASRPAFNPLFRWQRGKGLLPTGHRPTRRGFTARDLNLPDTYFTNNASF